jgi:hypothetical protein
MFDFFKKQNINPFANALLPLNYNQKESIVSLFIILAGSDQHVTKGINQKEFSFIDKYIEFFKLENQFTILEKYGIGALVEYLDTLNLNQQESLIILVWDLLASDGKPNDSEILDMNKTLNLIGISVQQIVKTLKENKYL